MAKSVQQEISVLKHIAVSIALVAILCLGAACERNAQPGPDLWAMVNGHPILRQQVERYYRSQFSRPHHPSPEEADLLKLNILDELINNQLLLQQAQKLGLEATDSEVEQKFSQLKTPYSDQEFQRQLDQRGISVDQLKNNLRERISIQKLINREITSKITVTKQEIADAYNRNRAAYNVAEPEYHIAQIVVTPHADSEVRNRKSSDATTAAQARRKIRMLLEKLRGGAEFAQLAMDYSEDPMTASTGGDLGFIAESALNQGPPALKRAVLALKPGKISGILHVKGSYRIIKLIARISPGERKLSDPQVQQSIREALHDRKEQLLRAAYLAELRDQAHVTNYLARQILAGGGNLPAEKGAQPASAPAASEPPSSAPPAGVKSQPRPSGNSPKPTSRG
jgi:peptidyl-prolyl cis-trans isomerase SurA